MKALTPVEIGDLDKLEAVIEKGKQTFVDVGLAVTEIRDRKLYRRDYETFEAYCQKRWGWSRKRGYQLIEAAAVVQTLTEEMSTTGRQNPIDTERAARVLSKFPVPVRKEIIKEVKKNGESVASVVRKHFPVPPSEPEVLCDKTGWPIPPKVLEIWNRSQEVQDLLTAVSKIRCALRDAQDSKDLLFLGINFSSAISDADNLYTEIKQTMPYAVCSTCQGQRAGHCVLCNGRGVISQLKWDECVPKETKTIREKARK